MKQIPLIGKYGKGKFAVVDDDDYVWLSTFKFWLIERSGYAVTSIKGKNVLLHLLLMPKKAGLETDHINRNKLDNRRANLRYVTRSENTRNVLRRDNPHGFRGVSFHPEYPRPWLTHCSFGGKYYYLASFKTKEQAAQAYVNFLDEAWKRPNEIKQIIFNIRKATYDGDPSVRRYRWLQNAPKADSV